MRSEFDSEHPGYCGAQDTFYVGNLRGVGRIYQQTFIDTYTKVGLCQALRPQEPHHGGRSAQLDSCLPSPALSYRCGARKWVARIYRLGLWTTFAPAAGVQRRTFFTLALE
jgi:hypothetical protein